MSTSFFFSVYDHFHIYFNNSLSRMIIQYFCLLTYFKTLFTCFKTLYTFLPLVIKMPVLIQKERFIGVK